MDKKHIYHNLGYSIRKTNKDEIEIKLSFLDGVLRGFFRIMIIAILIIISIGDVSHRQFPLSGIYHSIQKDIEWATNPDKDILPLYEKYLTYMNDDNFRKEFPSLKFKTYKEYRQGYIDRNKWQEIRAYLHPIWISFIAFLFFYPHHRTLRLNRKYRVLYSQNIMGTGVVPVPEKGDPLSGVLYDCFSVYPFGGGKRFSLFLMLKLFKGKARDGFFLGIYPTPNPDHNEHLIRAMREFFTEENPEFLQHIGRCYRTPWFRPLIAFCNSFSPIYFPLFRRKKAEKAIKAYLAEWNKLKPKEQRARYDAVQAQQKKMNEELKKQGFYNKVDNRWTWRD
ncbi:hypothetical protein HYE54_06150 [Aggregatibacter actinomycetemcomitans]|uniref:hypothetical protein n=1 Tax=Aggregatibacter actinomycetemcomitans TaxID=714 RepID=UPI00197B11F1|nr:hypothetical protein [Aggregatibacter actinomycetemcomitans]MBN6068340.1 hypothetical protein [Aggregatibacter actinomycetemcomitans]MBN6086429.1 hypothetical protein [Aggregatibacter actinomycetemcomitans]